MKKILHFLTLIFGIVLLQYSCKDPVLEPDPDPQVVDSVGDVYVWQTTGNEVHLLSKLAPINFSREIGDFTIVLDTTSTYQFIDGFGAALTGSSAYLINKMNFAEREALLTDLFDPVKGIGLNYLRITIGSSDFSIGTYSYCESPDINTFAIPQRDKDDLLPVLKLIKAINPTIKILASPWSAPAWMKANNSMYGGSLKGEEVYNDFAEYFVKYINAFKLEGVNIDAITIQNEPMYETGGYPTMKMIWTEQNTIIRDYLGPKFVANGIDTKIIIWDHNFDMSYYPINILNDPITRQYVAGTGWHGYGGTASALDAVQAQHPDKDIYFTEQSGGGWNTDSRMGNMFWYMKEFLMASVNRGSKNFIMWNLALNENNGPTTTTAGCQNCRGVVTIKTDGTYLRNEEYYLLGHFSKLVRLGAVRIKNSSTNWPGGLTISTFMNVDGSKVVVIMNRSGLKQKYNIRCGNRKFIYEQYNESVVSIKFN
ncbi:MAG TPA: glycoside hydrolase family 30 beta sandwich domain-containing protein [Paludibacter sp.]|nr:glycoside hydrolase family 30 beta sandwich domain-containing protein [Paludibacter sp.]